MVGQASKLERKKTGNAANLTNAGKGRPKGVPNKSTAAIKDMIIKALDKVGGVDYLVDQAEENPTAFMGLIGKVLPLQLTGEGDGPIKIEITRRIVSVPQ